MRTSSSGTGFVVALVGACGLVLLAGACGTAERPGAGGEPADRPADLRASEDAVIAAHRSLIRAFEDRDARAVVALLDPRPELLIFHPFVENRFDGRDEAGEGLARMFTRLSDLSWTEVHQALQIEGDVAWLTSQVLVQSPDLESPFIGRGTEIWVRRHEGWLLSHGHWSEHARLVGDDTPR